MTSTSRGGFNLGRRTLRSLGGLLGARAVSRGCVVLSTQMHVVRGCRKRCRRQMKGGAGSERIEVHCRDIHEERVAGKAW